MSSAMFSIILSTEGTITTSLPITDIQFAICVKSEEVSTSSLLLVVRFHFLVVSFFVLLGLVVEFLLVLCRSLVPHGA